MRLTLPIRIIAVHLVFTVAASVAAFVFVQRSLEAYHERWKNDVTTMPAEELLQPILNQFALSLLLRENALPEVQERDQRAIDRMLRAFVKDEAAIETIVVTDVEQRIVFSSDPEAVGQGYTDPAYRTLLASPDWIRRSAPVSAGKGLNEVMVPIFEDHPEEAGGRRRIGSVLVRYRQDNPLFADWPRLRPAPLSPKQYATPIVVLIVIVALGGILLNALTGLPVRRLEKALEEFRRRGFTGSIDVERLRLEGNLAATARAINEIGGKLAALDARGREREALLETLSESLEDGIVVLDPSGDPVGWNPAAVRLLAGPGGAGGDAAAFRRDLRTQPELLDAVSAPAPSTREIEIRRNDGERASVQVTVVPLAISPEREGRLVLLRDLAILHKVEAHILEAGRFAVLAHLAGGLAHEIRNPLHSIGVNAEVIEQYVSSPPDQARVKAMTESLDTIQQETRRLRDLLNNYLGLLRSAPVVGPVDLRDVSARVVQLLSYAALTSRVELRLEGDAEIPAVRGVPDRLQQAVLNLVLNAIQAMPDGGVVRIHTASSPGVVRLTVSDTGPGLPGDVAEGLFDPGVSTKPGGTGLGLPLVRMIAEAHGGSVWYRSKPGEGVAFTLILPALEDEAREAPRAVPRGA